MMLLSQYVADPLVTPLDKWHHPITHAEVKLSAQLRSRLPDIMMVDLNREASTPDEILNQLLASELRDLGFLIPSTWEGSEAACISFHRYPVKGEVGFFGSKKVSVNEISQKCTLLFLSIGADEKSIFSQTIMERMRHKSHGEIQVDKNSCCYDIDLANGQVVLAQEFWRACEDLGHIPTIGLSDRQIGDKLSGMIPFLSADTIPVIFSDVPGGVVQIVRDEGIWNRPHPKKNNHQLVIFDRELRFGGGFESYIEQKNRVTSANLFAQLQWEKRYSPLKDIYLGSSRFARTIANKEVLEEIIFTNKWITIEEIFSPVNSRDISLEIESGAVALLHLNVFDHRSPQCLKQAVNGTLTALGQQQKLKGLIVWGIDTLNLESVDWSSLIQTFMSLASILSKGTHRQERCL
jgi:hypothetical protein